MEEHAATTWKGQPKLEKFYGLLVKIPEPNAAVVAEWVHSQARMRSEKPHRVLSARKFNAAVQKLLEIEKGLAESGLTQERMRELVARK
ncbi:MAG: hypothetical protein QW343_01130 [Candidatus Norongarragalinales archaeon]